MRGVTWDLVDQGLVLRHLSVGLFWRSGVVLPHAKRPTYIPYGWGGGLGGSGKTCFLLALRLELPVQFRDTGMCALNTEHPGVQV
jgi:hypothetical protein